MTPLQLELTRLLGNGKTKFEPDGGGYDFIEEPDATLSDLHRWILSKCKRFTQTIVCLQISEGYGFYSFPYDCSLDLLDQTPETLTQIIELVKKYS